jgi:hypothetical protein
MESDKSDKIGLLRYGYTYQNAQKRAALMFQLYGIRMGV